MTTPISEPMDEGFECSFCSRNHPHDHWEFVTGPTTHLFHVLVTDCTAEQAVKIMAERMNHDEDHGFTYGINWKDGDQ